MQNYICILNKLPVIEPEWSKSTDYVRENIREFTWQQMKDFFTEVNRIN